jgi:hypothetical protein
MGCTRAVDQGHGTGFVPVLLRLVGLAALALLSLRARWAWSGRERGTSNDDLAKFGPSALAFSPPSHLKTSNFNHVCRWNLLLWSSPHCRRWGHRRRSPLSLSRRTLPLLLPAPSSPF